MKYWCAVHLRTKGPGWKTPKGYCSYIIHHDGPPEALMDSIRADNPEAQRIYCHVAYVRTDGQTPAHYCWPNFIPQPWASDFGPLVELEYK